MQKMKLHRTPGCSDHILCALSEGLDFVLTLPAYMLGMHAGSPSIMAKVEGSFTNPSVLGTSMLTLYSADKQNLQQFV